MKINMGSFEIELNTLIDTRLLIQANSGGGKSWCIRKLLEQSHGKVQQIVLDLEGEFATLREKYDYLLVGKGGDVPISIKTADLLAKKLLEMNVSAIIDLYELKQHERILFVKRFLDSMINAPKELWHPCLVIIDEAHVFAPEKGSAESMSSVIDLATRGRKRGYCAVIATQRLAKLHKDAAAECNNKIIGRAAIDIDMKRAAEELGFTKKEDMLTLRNLEAGEFFVFGPAISRMVMKAKVGEVKTTHPKAGSRGLISVPPATDAVKKMLATLGDLPKQADEELRTIEDFKKKIRELQFELRSKPKATIDENSLEVARRKGFKEAETQFAQRFEEIKKYTVQYQQLINKLGDGLQRIAKEANALISDKLKIEIKPPVDFKTYNKNIQLHMEVQHKQLETQKEKIPLKQEAIHNGKNLLRKGAMDMLKAVAMSHPNQIS